jgi:hypothetical protein
MPNCAKCGVNPVNNAWEICASCQGQKTLQRASAQQRRGAATPVPQWNTTMQAKGGLSGGGTGVFSGNVLNEALASIMACLEAHSNDRQASTLDQQRTIWPTQGEGTTTFDYQGTREGSGTSLWIDIQGQYGGGSTKRNSYVQIMVEVTGDTPPEDRIRTALRNSVKNTQRAVVHKGTDRPV